MSQSEKYLLTTTEYAQREGISFRTAKRYIQEGRVTIIKVKGRGRYRKNHLENRIHYTQLSTPEKQEAFLRDRGLLPTEEPQPDEEKKIYDLKPWQKKEADRREAIVKEWLKVSEDVPKSKIGAFKKSFAKQHSIDHRTLKRWVDAYRNGGYYALVPNWHSGNQQKIIDRKLSKLIENIYLKPYGPSIKETWERICKWCEDRNRQAPSYNLLVDHINGRWTKPQQLLIRNKQEWDRLYSPHVRRDWTKVALNEVWIGDAKQIDVCCLFRNKAIFPWFTGFLEAKSRKFVGWILTPSHDSWAIAQAFVYATSQHGSPQTIYIDRGKPYKSHMIAGTKVRTGPTVKLFGGLEKTYIPGIFRDLRAEIFYAAPYNAREKLIEPNFKIFTQRLTGLPGYRGHSVKTRPKKLAHEIKAGKLLSFEELSSKVDKLITDRNNHPHSTTGLPPNSYYETFTPVIPSQELLDYLLMDAHVKKVKDSTVTIQGLVYRGEDLWRLAGEDVEVRRDPRDLRRCVIIYQGKVFGPAYLEEADHFLGPITLESVKTCQRIRKKINKYQRFVIENEDVIDDPLRVAVQLDSEGEVRERDIRPSDSKVRSLNQKNRVAKQAKAVLKEEPRQGGRERKAVKRHPFFDRYSYQPNLEPKEPVRRPRLVKLDYKDPREGE